MSKIFIAACILVLISCSDNNSNQENDKQKVPQKVPQNNSKLLDLSKIDMKEDIFNAVGPVFAQIRDFKYHGKNLPNNNSEAGIPNPTFINSKYVKSVAIIKDANIVMTLKDERIVRFIHDNGNGNEILKFKSSLDEEKFPKKFVSLLFEHYPKY